MILSLKNGCYFYLLPSNSPDEERFSITKERKYLWIDQECQEIRIARSKSSKSIASNIIGFIQIIIFSKNKKCDLIPI
jgi:hypothetical protein